MVQSLLVQRQMPPFGFAPLFITDKTSRKVSSQLLMATALAYSVDNLRLPRHHWCYRHWHWCHWGHWQWLRRVDHTCWLARHHHRLRLARDDHLLWCGGTHNDLRASRHDNRLARHNHLGASGHWDPLDG